MALKIAILAFFLQFALCVLNAHGQNVTFPKKMLQYLETTIFVLALILIWFQESEYFWKNCENGCA